MIAHVYVFSNGMVMVFDERGEQIPEYQGRWSEKQDQILADAPEATEFIDASWRDGDSYSMNRAELEASGPRMFAGPDSMYQLREVPK